MGGAGTFKRGVIDPQFVVPTGTLHTPPGVVYLAEDHGAGDPAAFHRIVCAAVLRPAEQHIAPADPTGPCQKLAPRRAETQSNIPLDTGTHQSRRSTRIGKTDDLFQIVEGEPTNHSLIPVDQNIFPLETQVGIL